MNKQTNKYAIAITTATPGVRRRVRGRMHQRLQVAGGAGEAPHFWSRVTRLCQLIRMGVGDGAQPVRLAGMFWQGPLTSRNAPLPSSFPGKREGEKGQPFSPGTGPHPLPRVSSPLAQVGVIPPVQPERVGIHAVVDGAVLRGQGEAGVSATPAARRTSRGACSVHSCPRPPTSRPPSGAPHHHSSRRRHGDPPGQGTHLDGVLDEDHRPVQAHVPPGLRT